MRASHPTQLATARAILDARDAMATEWAAWLVERGAAHDISRNALERQLRLVIDTLVQMLGPLRREAKLVWQHVMEHYGRSAVARGLAAGEVVDEIAQLRLLLINHVGAFVSAMRPRRAVAVFLRLNAIVDRGITAAVVGYTDTLVTSLLARDGGSDAVVSANNDELAREVEQLEAELAPLR